MGKLCVLQVKKYLNRNNLRGCWSTKSSV